MEHAQTHMAPPPREGALAPFRRLLVRHRRIAVWIVDLSLSPVVYFLAFALRFGLPIPDRELSIFWLSTPGVVALRGATFSYWGVHRGSWMHVGMSDLATLLKAVSTGSLVLLAAATLLPNELGSFPATVVMLDWLLAMATFGGARFALRASLEFRRRRRQQAGSKARTLIVGTAEAAERLIREWTHRSSSEFEPIGIVDDEPARRQLRVHGVSTVGTTDDLASLVLRLRPDLLVIAVLSSSGLHMRDLIRKCRETGVAVRIMPSDRELRSGEAQAGQLRELQTEDLLGRDAVSLDLAKVRDEIRGQCILITGGAGSIGSELARQVLGHMPSRLVILDQAETPLYYTQLDLGNRSGSEIVPVIGSVSDKHRVRQLFAEHRPAVVFHAAAYKHVPLMEDNVSEAVRNNVFGTLCVAEAAVQFGARRFVLISTDKAVNPSCVMGATKRIAERMILGLRHLRDGSTDFRAVRFGNVLGSNGSVVPLFERQLQEFRVLTVTHPDVTRYFMTIPEAVQLVLQATVLPEAAGRICMLDMGDPLRIVDLAEAVIRRAGFRPHEEVTIDFTGLRPGEKLHEDLVSSGEALGPTSVQKVRIVRSAERDPEGLPGGLVRLEQAEATGSPEAQLQALCDLVPEAVDPLRALARRAAALSRSGPSVPVRRPPFSPGAGGARPPRSPWVTK